MRWSNTIGFMRYEIKFFYSITTIKLGSCYEYSSYTPSEYSRDISVQDKLSVYLKDIGFNHISYQSNSGKFYG